MDCKIRFATPDDHDLIYALKAESVRPYAERIWGWDEDYQRNDFDGDFSHIEQFHVIEIDGSFAGFVQYYFEYPYYEVVEIHLLPEYRGKGIGSDILGYLQKVCIAQDRKIRIGCFKENHRAKHLYQKLGFMQTGETDTHYILEYPSFTVIAYDEKYRDGKRIQSFGIDDPGRNYMIFTETDRLLLRNVAAKDADIMYDYRNNEICARYQRGQAKDYEGIVALVERHKDDVMSVDAPFMVAVALKGTDEMVGEIVVMPKDGTISLGYTFSYKHHRKGYAFESLSALIDMLHARCPEWDFISFTEPENEPSMALLKKLGYRDMGYIPAMESQVFGKWTTTATEAEIAQAAIRN